MEQTHIENTGSVKVCPICGKPMEQIVVQTVKKRWLELWTCPPCVKDSDRKRQKEAVI